MPPVILVGASSFLAGYVLSSLVQAGHGGVCLSRREAPPGALLPDGFRWEVGVSLAEAIGTVPGAWLVSVAPIWVLPDMLPGSGPSPAGVVALSSTSVLVKSDSADPAERSVAQALAGGERRLVAWAEGRGVPWTLLRPTMIYDWEHDANVTTIARMIRRFRFFPILSPASGRRQPIHAADVAAATVAAIGRPSAENQTFEIGGGETITYGEMVTRIGAALGRPKAALPLPRSLLKVVLPLLGGAVPGATLSAFDRMNQDLAFDDRPARQALGHAPRGFSPPSLPL